MVAANEEPTKPDESALFALDVIMLDRYLAFSTELARLAALGLGAIGYILSKPAAKGRPVLAIWIAVCAFLVAIAASLAHRYYGPDSLGEMIGERRHRERGNAAKADKLAVKWRRKFSISSALIRIAALRCRCSCVRPSALTDELYQPTARRQVRGDRPCARHRLLKVISYG